MTAVAVDVDMADESAIEKASFSVRATFEAAGSNWTSEMLSDVEILRYAASAVI